MTYLREVERKFLVFDMNWDEALAVLCKRYKQPFLQAISVDRFWKAFGVDFIRLRTNSRELTVKVTDKGTVTDRIEENMVVQDVDTAYRFMTLVHGEPCLTLTKEFAVFKAGDITLSLYRVLEDKAGRIFFEAEGPGMYDINLEVLHVPLNMMVEKRSLFSIFVREDAKSMKINWNCDVTDGPCACGATHE